MKYLKKYRASVSKFASIDISKFNRPTIDNIGMSRVTNKKCNFLYKVLFEKKNTSKLVTVTLSSIQTLFLHTSIYTYNVISAVE